jgi:alpha-tubulin suppressor-like RCC1 family protein
VAPVDGKAWAASAPRGAVAVAAGFACSACVVLTAEGATELYTWGANDYGVLGHGVEGGPDVLSPKLVALDPAVVGPPGPKAMKITVIECGGWHMACLVERDGAALLASGAALCSYAAALDPTKGASAAAGGGGPLATGKAAAAAEADSTRLFTWGAGACGQLGHGTFEDRCTPTAIGMLSSGKEVVAVSCGAAHTAAVLDVTSGGRRIKGQLWTWGNGVAATGQPDAAHSAVPRFFNFIKKGNQNNVAAAVSCGDNFTAVLDEDGNVTLVGLNPATGVASREVLELPKEDDSKGALDVEALAAGGSHLCLVMAERVAV